MSGVFAAFVLVVRVCTLGDDDVGVVSMRHGGHHARAPATRVRCSNVLARFVPTVCRWPVLPSAFARSSSRPSTSRRTRSRRCCGGTPLVDVSPRSLPGLDRRTVNYVHTIVHPRSRTPFVGGRLARNPADAANPPRSGQKSDGIQAWDAPTLRSFLELSARSNDRLHALWVVLATTGMRRGEAIGLRWTDLDLDAGRLRVVQTVIQMRSMVAIGEPKTARGRRPIALDKATDRRPARAPPQDAGGATARRPRLRRPRLRVPPSRRLVATPRRGERDVPPSCELLRPAAPVTARTAPHMGHARAGARDPPASCPRALRPLHDLITLGMYSHVGPTLHDEAAETIAGLVL